LTNTRDVEAIDRFHFVFQPLVAIPPTKMEAEAEAEVEAVEAA